MVDLLKLLMLQRYAHKIKDSLISMINMMEDMKFKGKSSVARQIGLVSEATIKLLDVCGETDSEFPDEFLKMVKRNHSRKSQKSIHYKYIYKHPKSHRIPVKVRKENQ